MGGAGNDLYLMAAATGNVIIDDASGTDTVSLAGMTNDELLASDISSLAGIDAFDLAGGGNMLHLTAARALSVSGTGLFRVFGSGGDKLVLDDTGWARTGSSGGFDTLSNNGGNATVIASTGLVSSDIGSVVNGGDGNDTLAGGNGADTIDGGNGSDIIAGFGGSDSILAGDGNDSLSGGDGADTVLGGLGNDQIQGGNGNDSLSGGDGDDTLVGGGDDTLTGGAGNDLYVAGSTSLTLQINDSGGNDTLSFQGATGGSISAAALGSVNGIEAITLAGGGNTLNLSANRVAALSDTDVLRVFGSGSDRLVFDDAASWTRGTPSAGFVNFTNGSATVIAAESLVPVVSGPTAGNDTLSGSNGNDVIDLLAGSDSYLGLDGDDVIQGNDGADTIYGGNGADSIAGGNNNDLIYGETGSDTIDAGAGTSDRISYNLTGGQAITATINSSGGSAGINTATVSTATQGTDSIQGFEALSGSVDGDLITVTTSATQNTSLFLFGSVGNDTIIDNYRQTGVFADYNTTSTSLTSGVSVDLTSGIATDGLGGTDSLVGITAVSGTSLADTMLGSASNDRFRGLQGNDLMDGRGGTGDMVDYGANTASQAVSVNLATGRANDGLGGTDTLISIEQVRGSAGNDTIIGDSLGNIFRGNAGNDYLDGGAGTADAADYSFATAGISVNLLTGRGTDGQAGTDTLENIERIQGSDYADTLIGGNGGADSLSGGNGDDLLSAYGSSQAVRFEGGDGNDELYDGSGADTMAGGAGNDTIYSTAGADSVNGGDGDDNIDAGGSVFAVRLDGGAGHDTLYAGFVTGGSGGNTLSGGTGNDLLQVGPYGSNSLSGDGGNDSLEGGAGNDTLSGGIGSDSLIGGNGNDFYFVDDTSDQIIELTGRGADTIISSVSFSSPGQVEALQIAAGVTGITLTGGAGNDMLVGNGLANNINGGAGDDVILAGNVTLADIYALFGP